MLNWFAARTFRSSFCGQANDKFVARLRGFGPIGIIAISPHPRRQFHHCIAQRDSGSSLDEISGTPWREVGYVRPRSWAQTIGTGVASSVTVKFVMKALVMARFQSIRLTASSAGTPRVIPVMITQ